MEKHAAVDEPIVICQDGTIGTTSGSITFLNYNVNPCAIISCSVPGWPSPPQANPVVPAAQNGVPGTLTLPLLRHGAIPVGSYPYQSNCCPGGTPPKIIVS